MKLILGDSLQKLKDLPTNTIDACVTDPPYALNFMGKKWDAEVPSVELWKEVFRVLKPGGHVLSFGGTRTYHHMAMNVELAGFEIRDMLQWLYGSGFPKSLDVSKAIDKAAGARGHSGKRFNASGDGDRSNGGDNLRSDHPDYVAPVAVTDDAKRWQGFGTALKPANEPIVLARKPLEKGLTVAQNVLKWGTGALAIDASRIGSGEDRAAGGTSGGSGYRIQKSQAGALRPTGGRWPANVLFDEEAAAMLDEQSGVLKSGELKGYNIPGASANGHLQGKATRLVEQSTASTGGASRFFYVAKSSKRERNSGLDDKTNGHPTVKPIRLMEYLVRLATPPGGIVLDPFMGSGTTGCAAVKLGYQFIGIEREQEYIEIARKRIEHWAKQAPDETPDDDQLSFPEAGA